MNHAPLPKRLRRRLLRALESLPLKGEILLRISPLNRHPYYKAVSLDWWRPVAEGAPADQFDLLDAETICVALEAR